MRVLIVTGSYPPLRCGVGDYSAALAAALAKVAGVEVTILTSVGAERHREGGCEIRPSMRLWNLAELATFVRTVNRIAPDIVHVQYPTQGYGSAPMPYLLPLMTRLLGRRAVATLHEPLPRSVKGLFAALLMVAASAFVVVRGNFMALNGAAQAMMLKTRALRFIPNATAIPETRLTAGETADERARFGVQPGRRLVVFFGFLLPSKGAEFLFAIADRERDHLLLIGEGAAGSDLKERLEAQATAEGWDGHITFTGFLAPVAVGRALAAADAVVLPYRSGAGHWNTSVHAAQIQGTFLVTTSHTQRGYVPSNNTWWCPPDDVPAMRAALDSGIGRRSEPAVLSGWPEIAAEHLAVYRAVAERP